MKQFKLLALLGMCCSLVHAETIVLPEQTTNVVLSNENPNRIVCQNGDINDLSAPKDLPIDPKAKGQNLFLSYLKSQMPNGEIKLVGKVHSMHVVCGGEVYSLTVTPRNGQARQIRLGDPQADKLKQNTRIMREKTQDQIIASMIKAAYHNELPPNYVVTTKQEKVEANIPGLSIVHVRTASLQGIGLSVKEYLIKGQPGTLAPHRLFIENGIYFSERLRGVSVKPEQIGEQGFTRLFIVEDRL